MLRANGAAVAARSRLTRRALCGFLFTGALSLFGSLNEHQRGDRGFGPDRYYSTATWGGGRAPGNSC